MTHTVEPPGVGGVGVGGTGGVDLGGVGTGRYGRVARAASARLSRRLGLTGYALTSCRRQGRVVMAVSEALPEVPAAAVPDQAWLLDVREDDEWAAGHVPGATHIPLGQLGTRTGELPPDDTIYVICRSGMRSARAAQALSGAGWQAINVAGGMQEWAEAGRSMVTDSGAPPFVA
jgi:rhodanese-related sulfurtransferase